MRRTFKVVDLFSGAGGFSRGFDEAGFTTLLGIDNHPAAAKSFKANFPRAVVLSEDVKTVTGDDIRELIGSTDVDVVLASPPCEPFTGANPKRQKHPVDRLYKDPAGQLFLHAIRLIGELSPRLFFIENVKGILENEIQDSIRRELRRTGYREVYFNVVNAEDHGVPSRRIRVIVSNIKLELPREPKITVGKALLGLPPPGSPYPPNHEYTTLSRSKARRVKRVKWGGHLVSFTGANGRRLPNMIRLDPRKPAPTVLGSSQFIHPYEDRLLTVREQARLMGFPDYHVFLGSRDAQYNQVGEAVPPPLSYRIAKAALAKLN